MARPTPQWCCCSMSWLWVDGAWVVSMKGAGITDMHYGVRDDSKRASKPLQSAPPRAWPTLTSSMGRRGIGNGWRQT